MELETHDKYEQGGSYWMYSCVGIQARSFLRSVLTLEAVMSRDFHNRDVHACWTTSGKVCRVGPRAGKFMRALESLRKWLSVCLSRTGYETGVAWYKGFKTENVVKLF